MVNCNTITKALIKEKLQAVFTPETNVIVLVKICILKNLILSKKYKKS